MQPVGVLARVHALEDRVRVDSARQRQLDDVAGARVVGVQLVDDGLDLGLRRRRRQVTADRGDADLGAVAVLAGDVRPAARVVPDEDRAKTRDDAGCPQAGHPFAQVGFHVAGQRPCRR